MRVMVRLLSAIWIATLVIIAVFAWFEIREERQRLTRDLERRASLLAESLKESVEPALLRNSVPAVTRLLKKFATPTRRIAVYDSVGGAIAAAPAPLEAPLALPEVSEAITRAETEKALRKVDGVKTFVYVTPLQSDDRTIGALLVMLDASHLGAADQGTWQYNGVRFLVVVVVLSLITLLVVRASVTRPLTAMAVWAKTLKRGRPVPPPDVADASLFGPLAVEVAGLAKTLYRAQVAVEEEASLRLRGDAIWTEERLKQFVKLRLGDRPLFVVSNREPVSHVWQNGQAVQQVPASGVVTALEPVMRACGGVWVAHGSGDADQHAADPRGRLGLPTDDPRYTLRRIWLTEQEETGYYYGFANEGLWPLCHVVHARPLFRAEDWAYYCSVNRKFAVGLLEEMAGAEAPLVLLQDYHFALLPALIKAERPDARVALFWHIPWPNSEAFGICPWQAEILRGMLGADLIGFHTQYHCNNFLETVERTLEARIDGEHFAVVRGQQVTHVQPFPISVAPGFGDDRSELSRQDLLDRLGIEAEFIGVGVERVDYTKGLPERFLALQRFFELYPTYRERLVFVQLAAPSRTRILRYRDLQEQVESTAASVNAALQTKNWRPILYLPQHHDRREIDVFYRHADFCMVTSLHDGMNLVAKEFVVARDDGDGVLILSRLTGAARELREALLVNPYDLDGTAEAVRMALEMPADERRARMRRMHDWVREHNVYRWAGRLVDELSRVPEPAFPVRSSAQ